MMEAQTSKAPSWFITLTYEDDKIPHKYRWDDEGTVYMEGESILIEDLQLYHKRLREAARKIGQKDIKFFSAGEYGDTTLRPHYHEAIFNLEIPDIKIVSKNNKYTYYSSQWLERIWSKGQITIGLLEWQSAAYIAKYMLKKQKGQNAEIYDQLCCEPPRSICSNGIGKKYWKQNRESIYRADMCVVRGKTGIKLVKPPRIFDRWEAEEGRDIARLKDQRASAANQTLYLQKQQISTKQAEQFINQETRIKNHTRLRRKL